MFSYLGIIPLLFDFLMLDRVVVFRIPRQLEEKTFGGPLQTFSACP